MLSFSFSFKNSVKFAILVLPCYFIEYTLPISLISSDSNDIETSIDKKFVALELIIICPPVVLIEQLFLFLGSSLHEGKYHFSFGTACISRQSK